MSKGAGSAAIACVNLLISCGFKAENVMMLDSRGVIHSERTDLNEYKAAFAIETACRTLEEGLKALMSSLGCQVQTY